MALIRLSGGGRYNGGGGGGGGRYNGGGGGRYNGGGGGRYNAGGGSYRFGAAGTVIPWKSSSDARGPIPRLPLQGGHLQPAQLNMASNPISKLLSSTNSMPGSGYDGGPSRNGNWGSGSPRMAYFGMPQRQVGPDAFNNDNKCQGGDPHQRFSGGGVTDGDKLKSTGKVNEGNNKRLNKHERSMTKEQLDAVKKASYVGVPSAVLYCHVCSKHLWDSETFEKHVRGGSHALMMTNLDEEYQMQVNFMRLQVKADEIQREIDLERYENRHKSTNSNNNSDSGSNLIAPKFLRSRYYCTMCDVCFYGPLSGHRKSDWHRKLKKFLHPECKLCDTLFHTRLEMDEHKLTASHLKKFAENRNLKYPNLKNDEFDLIDMIEIEEEQQDHDQIPVANKNDMLLDRDASKLKLELKGGSGEKKDSSGAESNVAATIAITSEDKKVEENGDKKEEEMETFDVAAKESAVEDTATDHQSIKEVNATNAESVVSNKEAVYDPNIAIGKELLVASEGFVCRMCNVFLLDEERITIHCQTSAHNFNYKKMAKKTEATSGGKKFGIDQVVEDDSNAKKVDDVANEDKNGGVVDSENVVFKELDTESEEPAVKRMKVETEETI